jgi:hypothetical protein
VDLGYAERESPGVPASLRRVSAGPCTLGAMKSFSVFLKLAGDDEWKFVGLLKAEDEYKGAETAQRLIANFLMDHEDAVDEQAELRGPDTGKVYMRWTPVHE